MNTDRKLFLALRNVTNLFRKPHVTICEIKELLLFLFVCESPCILNAPCSVRELNILLREQITSGRPLLWRRKVSNLEHRA